jgi:hypothetical protein
MRKVQEVILEGLEPVRMKEMTVSHFPIAIRFFKDLLAAGNLTAETVGKLVLERYTELVQVLIECSSLNEEAFREIGACDLLAIIEGWVTANQSFFDQIRERVPTVTIPEAQARYSGPSGA